MSLFKLHLALAAILLLPGALANFATDIFDSYINRDEPDFKWHYTGRSFSTLMGGRAYVLNVTSLKWLTDDDYDVIGGNSVWTHEVVVIVPRELEFKNVATLYMASAHGGCNNEQPIENTFNFDLEMGDIFAADSRAIGVVSF